MSEIGGDAVVGTTGLQSGCPDLESMIRAALVVIADPVVAASGPPATLDEIGGRDGVLLERPAGTILGLANPHPDSAVFVSVGRDFVAVVADPDGDTPLGPVGELTVCSGRLVVGAPDVVAAWGADVDTGDGSRARARIHRGRTRLGLIVVAHVPCGGAPLAVGPGAAVAGFPSGAVKPTQLRLAG